MSESLVIEIVEQIDPQFGMVGWYLCFPNGHEYGQVVTNIYPGSPQARERALERTYDNIEAIFKRKAKPVSDDYPEPNDAEKAALGEVPYTAEHPDFVAEPVEATRDMAAAQPGNPNGPVFTDLSARTCYDRAAMSLLYAEQHARDVAEEHRANAAAWMTFGNNLRAVGL